MKTPSCGRRRLSSLVESMNAVRAVATVMVGLIHLKPTNLAVAVLAICRHVDVENMPLEDTLLLWRKGSLAPVDHLHCDAEQRVIEIDAGDQLAQKNLSVFRLIVDVIVNSHSRHSAALVPAPAWTRPTTVPGQW